ncbi:uncharacterized protein LOC114756586 [Neltuma alba]|uniref:uncharacterized protein LOC114756586 n=1 Tax=Neltuma alba TaxID=207710 RepID=UPI0010A5622A|nr:uncharacterized protein LOC114756586 [Prosopis alba]
MSDDNAAATPSPDAIRKAQSAIQSLSSLVPSIPTSLSSSNNPALSLLHDSGVSSCISALLREPNSGSGDNNLCRWLYDTFQSGIPELQLVVLRFLPVITGIYLTRIVHRKPQAGFEAVLLALYASETNARSGQAVTVTIPDLSNPSVYHESKSTVKNNATNLDLAVVSHSLEPHGTVRSSRRARIVGVTLELYNSKISQMPVKSKIELCEFCKIWAGQDGDMYKGFGSEAEHKQSDEDEEDEEVGDGEEEEEEERDIIITEEEKRMKKKEGRIPLPWELLQPILRILGHCLMGLNNSKEKELFDAASDACRSLYARAVHDVNPKAILATASLLRLLKRLEDNKFDDFDHFTNVIPL